MQERELKIVENFKRLVAKRVTVNEVRVFGSRARGDASEDSDLDVLIVVARLNHEIDRYISECAWEAGFSEDIVLVPVAVSSDNLKNSPLRESMFIRNVYREGVGV